MKCPQVRTWAEGLQMADTLREKCILSEESYQMVVAHFRKRYVLAVMGILIAWVALLYGLALLVGAGVES